MLYNVSTITLKLTFDLIKSQMSRQQGGRSLSVSGIHALQLLQLCEALSPDISYYTLSACIRTFTRPVHDVPLDEM